MKSIAQILNFLNIQSANTPDFLISSLHLDSRKCDSKTAFIALKGLSSDGNDYVTNAVAKGVRLILTDSQAKLEETNIFDENDIKISFVANLKDKLADIAQWFYAYKKPTNLVGVTGTNGKTSISNYISQLQSLMGQKSLLLGTNGNGIYPKLKESTHTTLDILSLYQTIAGYKNYQNLVMEVSSHSLDQERTKGLDFDVAVFSNLSLDHLNYHKNMENYFLAKTKLFQEKNLKYSIINIDDEYGERLVKLAKGKLITVSLLDNTADIYLQILSIENMATRFVLYSLSEKIGEYETTLLGKFNLMNLALSIAVLKVSDCLASALKNIINIKSVKGRMEVISLKNDVQIIIDYAHTPDALKNALQTLQQYKTNKLWCIFGCGGDRDTSKRAIMANMAEKYADNIVVTEDNNRFEKVENIFTDIKQGFKNTTNHNFIVSRAEAIRYAINNAKSGDIILLAGKGHELYIDKKGVKEYFDEREVIAKWQSEE